MFFTSVDKGGNDEPIHYDVDPTFATSVDGRKYNETNYQNHVFVYKSHGHKVRFKKSNFKKGKKKIEIMIRKGSEGTFLGLL